MALAITLPGAASADPGSFHGSAQAGYQRVERYGVVQPFETWVKTIETAYAHSLPGEIELSSRVRFGEQTVVGQRNRLRNPEGSLRLAHRYFGLSASYQPSEARDSRDVTTRQQNLAFTANAQKPGLPSVSGSWVRTHADPNSGTIGLATVTRSLSSNYNVSHLALRAGYGDRSFQGQAGYRPGLAENHVSLGSSLGFQLGKAPVSMQYDFSQSRANRSLLPSVVGRVHTAGLSSSLAFTKKTSAGLSYNYQRTEARGIVRSITDDHNGSLSLSHRFTPGVQLSTGGGVRAARIVGRSETESFAGASISAQGQARPGWRVGASAGRSYNWLPGERVRASDALQTNTWLRLARGLEAQGNFSVSAGRRSAAALDSAQDRNRVGVQTGAGITARPLRSVSLLANVSRSASGPSIWTYASATTSYSLDLRLMPAQRLQLSGGWNRSEGATSRGTTLHANATLGFGATMQASGGYNRSSQRILGPYPSTPRPQESVSGTLGMALGRNMSASLRYNEAAWGRPGHVRQMNVDVVRTFGR